MREILHVHIGQCGINIADALYSQKPEWAQRAILIDTDAEAIDRFMVSSPVRHLINSKNLRTQRSEQAPWDQSTCYNSMKSMRLAFEKCDNPEGLVLFHSSSSGTGTGVADYLLQDTGKLECMLQTVWPNQSKFNNEGPLSTYNFIALLGDIIERNPPMIFPYTNEMLYQHSGGGLIEANQLIAANYINMFRSQSDDSHLLHSRRVTLRDLSINKAYSDTCYIAEQCFYRVAHTESVPQQLFDATRSCNLTFRPTDRKLTIANLMVSSCLTPMEIEQQFLEPFLKQSAEIKCEADQHLNVFPSSSSQEFKVEVSYNQQSAQPLYDYLKLQLKMYFNLWEKRAFCHYVESTHYSRRGHLPVGAENIEFMLKRLKEQYIDPLKIVEEREE